MDSEFASVLEQFMSAKWVTVAARIEDLAQTTRALLLRRIYGAGSELSLPIKAEVFAQGALVTALGLFRTRKNAYCTGFFITYSIVLTCSPYVGAWNAEQCNSSPFLLTLRYIMYMASTCPLALSHLSSSVPNLKHRRAPFCV